MISKILDLASHNAIVTGEWYIPGHKLKGLWVSSPRFEFSSRLGKCEYTEMKFEGEEFEMSSIDLGLWACFSSPRQFLEQVVGIVMVKPCKYYPFGSRVLKDVQV